jgi:hypothetical protein
MFADWVAGISPPDPETINKHVRDMVEVSLSVTIKKMITEVKVSYFRGFTEMNGYN